MKSNELGQTQGGDIQATAGSQLPQGDPEVEPEGAPLPSTSVLSPPVPCSDASWAALAGAQYVALVEAVDAYKAALALPDSHEMADLAQSSAEWSLKVAAVEFVARMRKRAEGGDNKKAEQ